MRRKTSNSTGDHLRLKPGVRLQSCPQQVYSEKPLFNHQETNQPRDRGHSIPPLRPPRLIAQEHAGGSESVISSSLKTPENQSVDENDAQGKPHVVIGREKCFIGKKHAKCSTKLPNGQGLEQILVTEQSGSMKGTKIHYEGNGPQSFPKVVDHIESSGSRSHRRCLVKCPTGPIRRSTRLASLVNPMLNSVIDTKSRAGLSSGQSPSTAQCRSRKRSRLPYMGEGFLHSIPEVVVPLGDSGNKLASRRLKKCSTVPARQSSRLVSTGPVPISKDPAQRTRNFSHYTSCSRGSRNLLQVPEGRTISSDFNAIVAQPKVLEDVRSTEVTSMPICVAHQKKRSLGKKQASCSMELPGALISEESPRTIQSTSKKRKRIPCSANGFLCSIPKVVDPLESSGLKSPDSSLVKLPPTTIRRSARLASRVSHPMVKGPTQETRDLKHFESCNGGSRNLWQIPEGRTTSRDFNAITPILAPPKVLEDVRSTEVTSKPIRMTRKGFRRSPRKPSNSTSAMPSKASNAKMVRCSSTREVDITMKHSVGGSSVSMIKERFNPVALTSKELIERKREKIEDSGRKGSSIQTGETSGECILPEWTKEQEEALQRAYFIAKPSPHFWKKVSKMVPGKSPQECFNRIQADLATPLQRQPRSKANRMNFSPIGSMSLAESNSSVLATRRLTTGKQKSLIAHKTVRHLLRKHQLIDQNVEADFFSVFEPSPFKVANFSVFEPSPFKAPLDFPEAGMHASDERVPYPVDFLQHKARSSVTHNKMFTMLNTAKQSDSDSPAVLKQVKNIGLHEKYIDQLHRREAHRKAYTKTASSTSTIAGCRSNSTLRTPVLKAAKNALLCEANDFLHEFRKKQGNFTVDEELLGNDEEECSDQEDD